jgi:hypothetical protein
MDALLRTRPLLVSSVHAAMLSFSATCVEFQRKKPYRGRNTTTGITRSLARSWYRTNPV